MSVFTQKKNENIDILNDRLVPSVIRFTIPIAVSSILQQLFNAADTTVVGRFAGSGALAAVGTNSELVALIVTVSSGLAVGSNVLIARMIGEDRKDKLSDGIFSSLLVAVIIGLIGEFAGAVFTEDILHLINAPSAVFDSAVSYLKIYLLGYPFLVLYDFSAAIFRAQGDSRRPFLVLMISGGFNVLLNLIFVIAFHLGVTGVAIATDLANLFSCSIMMLLLFRKKDFRPVSFTVSFSSIRNILMIGMPAAVQGAVFCFANLFVTASVNSFGELAASGSTISINYEYITYYVVTAFGQTATTFISQNSAAGNAARCRDILKYCLIFGILFNAAMTVPLVLFSRFFASIFSNDPQVIRMAALRMKIILALEPLCAVYEVLSGALRGRKYSLQPTLTAMLGICAVRILWILTVFAQYHTLTSLFIIFPASWIVTDILMIILYQVLLTGKISKAVLHTFRVL